MEILIDYIKPDILPILLFSKMILSLFEGDVTPTSNNS
jgi:hypothetical protein